MNTPEQYPKNDVSSYVKAAILRILRKNAPHFQYSKIENLVRTTRRKIDPVTGSPWTKGEVDDISQVHLVPPEKLRGFFSDCIDTLRNLKGDDIGDYLEFGVFNGSSMGSMFLTSQDEQVKGTRFFGFDSFEGLPKEAEDEDGGVWEEGFYKCSLEQTEEALKNRGVDPSEINWIKGWYNKTLTPYTAEKYDIDNIGIAFIDCDTYSSTKSTLDFLAPMISQPLIVCLDDWKLNDLDIKEMGVYKSFNEFLQSNPHLQAKAIPSYNRKSKSFLITPIAS